MRQRLPKLPLPWALRVGIAACAGLEAVHPHAVHRDLKPENIHLSYDAVVRLLDLGAGKFHRLGLLTTGGGTPGTVPYMAPEQLTSGAKVDARTDLFALGVVLTELIAGVHPFAPQGLANENVFTLVRTIVTGAPVTLRALAPWVPEHVALTLERALVREPTRRPSSAAEFGAALADALHRLEDDVGLGAPLASLVTELRQAEDGAEAAPIDVMASTASAPSAPAPSDELDTLVLERARRGR